MTAAAAVLGLTLTVMITVGAVGGRGGYRRIQCPAWPTSPKPMSPPSNCGVRVWSRVRYRSLDGPWLTGPLPDGGAISA